MKIKDVSIDVLERAIKRAKELREKGLSFEKIRKSLKEEFGIKVSKATVIRWVKGSHTPFRKTRLLRLKPSPELSYIIGVYFGDGYIKFNEKHYHYIFGLKAVDKDFVETVIDALRKIGFDPKIRYERDSTRSDRWAVEVKSKHLYQFLSQEDEKLFKIAEKYPEDFLRGLFDSDGGFSSGRVFLTNSDKNLLNFVSRLLTKMGIEHRIVLKTRKGEIVKCRGIPYKANVDIYDIVIGKKFSILKFYKKINFSIKRKREKLEKYLFGCVITI